VQLTSAAFSSDGAIPAEYTCDGSGVSPPLDWNGAPPDTTTLALMVTDPDAPSGAFTHWVLFNIPANVSHLPADVPRTGQLSDGTMQGKNSFGHTGYGAPCPPRGSPAHRYRFSLFAAGIALNLPVGASKGDVLRTLQGHIIEQAQLEGTYQRSSR
jgi:Raf kinase inhibitor-like YbhB/YbcL family protein